MHHLVYKTIRKSTGEYYIGVHSTHNINDMYMGSGDRIKRIISKEGKVGLERTILYECGTRAEALLIESTLLTSDVLNDPLCLNVAVGGKGNPSGGHGISDDARNRLHELHAGKQKSQITRQRISESKIGKPSPLKGMPRSEATKQKISESSKGKPKSEATKQKISESSKGRTRSQETIEKIRAARKGGHHTPDSIARMKKPKPTITCPHCGQTGGLPQMKRWHMDSCPCAKDDHF